MFNLFLKSHLIYLHVPSMHQIRDILVKGQLCLYVPGSHVTTRERRSMCSEDYRPWTLLNRSWFLAKLKREVEYCRIKRHVKVRPTRTAVSLFAKNRDHRGRGYAVLPFSFSTSIGGANRITVSWAMRSWALSLLTSVARILIEYSMYSETCFKRKMGITETCL